MARKIKTLRDALAYIDAEESLDGLDLTLFSDLGGADLAEVERRWPEWPVRLRRALLAAVGEIAEDNYRVDFDALSRLGLDDPDGQVRVEAISNLWESGEPHLIATFISLMLNDPEVDVRAEAAKGLGRYVYLGECDELLPAQARRAEDALLGVIAGVDDIEVRRRAIEAVAFSSRPEVIPIIEAAYQAPDERMRVSALFAMGRNLDERWKPVIQRELHSPTPEMRFEAARAAGELAIVEAVPQLVDLTNDADGDVQRAAIWSLGEIGGDEAKTALRRRRRTASADLREWIDDALANAELDTLGFGMLEFDDSDARDVTLN